MKTPRFVQCSTCDVKLPEEAARMVDGAVKELPQDLRTPRRKTSADLTATDPSERTDVSYVSTPAVDHDKEVVVPAGMDLSVYDKNRIVLYQHDQTQPCGKCLWVKADGRGVLAKTFYPERPARYDGDWLPERVWGLVQAEILRGKSVTFLPLELAEPDAEQKALGAEVVFPRSLLLEYSVVALPCCPDALVQAVNKHLDLDLLGIHRTGQRVTPRLKRTELVDRTPDFLRAVSRLSVDADAVAERVMTALKNRGRL